MKQKIINSNKGRLSVLVEPEGEQYDLESNDELELIYENDCSYTIVFGSNDLISLYPDRQSTYPKQILINGIDRTGGFHIQMNEYSTYHKISAQQTDASETMT